MSKTLKIFLAWLLLIGFAVPSPAYSTQFADSSETLRLHWAAKLIPIAFSNSLLKPNPYIKPDSDIQGAIERSLEAWEKAAAIKFQISWTDKQTISSIGKSGDGVSLVTIAQTPENLLMFGEDAKRFPLAREFFSTAKATLTKPT
jgi:hypothetical protein